MLHIAYYHLHTSLCSSCLAVPDMGLSQGLLYRHGMGIRLQPRLLGTGEGLQRRIQSMVESADAL